MEALKPCPTCGRFYKNAPSPDPRPAAQPGVVKALERARLTMERYRRAGLGDDVFHADLCESIEAADAALAAPSLPEDVERVVDATMQAIIDQCRDERLFLGTVNAREVIRRHLESALSSQIADRDRLAAENERLRAPVGGPVPTDECEFRIGQPVRLAEPYAGDDPNLVYFVTGIRWEHRPVPARGWDITIATAEELAKGHGQTDGFAPSDLRAALASLEERG